MARVRRSVHLLVVAAGADALGPLSRAIGPHACAAAPPTALRRCASFRPSMLAPEGAAAESADSLYGRLLGSPPFRVVYAPEFYDEGLRMWIDRRVVGIDLTPAGWTLIAVTLAWTLWSPYGLVAYYRRGGRFPSEAGREVPTGEDDEGAEGRSGGDVR